MDRLAYLLVRLLQFAVCCLPLTLAYRVGALTGWVASWMVRPYWRLVVEGMSRAFEGEKTPGEVRALARRHFVQLGGNLFSSVKMASMPSHRIARHVEIEGAELIREAGSGVVMVLSHLSNWEVLAQMGPLALPGVKTSTFYQRIRNRYLDADVRRARARTGMEPLERRAGYTRALAILREGGVVGVLVDQHAGKPGVWCPFFGRLASTSPLPATLALRTRAPLLMTSVYTVRPGHWKLVVERPELSGSRDIRVTTAEINQALEKRIRRAPADWFWVHDRWKGSRPDFLLARYKRGYALPPGFDRAALKPFRILVRSTNWLGDAVMATPAVQAIKQGRPDAHVTVLAPAKLGDYWRATPEVDAVLAIEPGDSPFDIAPALRGRFDAAVVLPNSPRAALEVWLARLPNRMGYPGKWRSRLLTQTVPPPRPIQHPQPARHQVYHYLRLAQWVGAPVGNPKTSDFFAQAAPLPGDPAVLARPLKIGLCPGAEFGEAKRWLPERFAEAAVLVSARMSAPASGSTAPVRHVEWQLFGVEKDAAIGRKIEAQIRQGLAAQPGVGNSEGNGKAGPATVTNLIGKTTLAGLIDRLSECALLLTNDTGTMHLATALGIPVVAIFGSTEPQLTGPLGPGHRVLRHQAPCSPCFQRTCPLDFRCMKAVSAQEAAEAALERLSGLSKKERFI